MDWNGNFRMPYLSRPAPDPSNFSFLYNNCTTFDHYPAEMKQQASMVVPSLNLDPKKKRLSNEQLEMLENSFQDEIKLDPERKIKLAKDLGLHPRQIAVWFQNRRARWKAKQLERLYDALKQEYDAVSRDKHKLQQEVLALRAILKDEVGRKQASTDISREETVESTSIPISDNRNPATTNLQQIAQCNYPLNMDDDFNNGVVMMPPPPYWPTAMPSCP